MNYKLIITERAEELLDNLLYYLIYQKKNEQAAKHLLDSVEQVYSRLEENPFQFPKCRNSCLSQLGYREAVFLDMKYLAIFRVKENNVYIVGVFHELEQYQEKCSIVREK